jgi:hypothetical protein
VLTVFAVPKPFTGQINVIQRNAITSWIALGAETQVVLIGDEPGTAEAATELGADHLQDVKRNELGTPRLDDAFRLVDEVARFPLRCFVNADVLLLDDFLPAVARVRARWPAFLAVGRTFDLAVDEPLPLTSRESRDELRQHAARSARSRGVTAIDYFVFTPGLFDPLPSFSVGRARFDNWLIWRARQRGPVIDVSQAVRAIHQRHDYGHIGGGLAEAHFGAEAQRNLELAGGKGHLFTIHDSSHVLTSNGRLRRNLGAVLRARERLRKTIWKLTPASLRA